MLRITDANMRIYLVNVIAALSLNVTGENDELIAKSRLMLQMLED